MLPWRVCSRANEQRKKKMFNGSALTALKLNRNLQVIKLSKGRCRCRELPATLTAINTEKKTIGMWSKAERALKWCLGCVLSLPLEAVAAPSDCAKMSFFQFLAIRHSNRQSTVHSDIRSFYKLVVIVVVVIIIVIVAVSIDADGTAFVSRIFILFFIYNYNKWSFTFTLIFTIDGWMDARANAPFRCAHTATAARKGRWREKKHLHENECIHIIALNWKERWKSRWALPLHADNKHTPTISQCIRTDWKTRIFVKNEMQKEKREENANKEIHHNNAAQWKLWRILCLAAPKCPTFLDVFHTAPNASLHLLHQSVFPTAFFPHSNIYIFLGFSIHSLGRPFFILHRNLNNASATRSFEWCANEFDLFEKTYRIGDEWTQREWWLGQIPKGSHRLAKYKCRRLSFLSDASVL